MRRRQLIGFGAAVAVAPGGLHAQPRRPFDLQAHRGGRGLWPENTLAAFERALRLGVTTLEMDTGVTADGVVVVHHDRLLNPALARDAQGRYLRREDLRLHALRWDELQVWDVGRRDPDAAYGREFNATQQAVDGQRIPRLADVFALVRRLGADAVQFDIETKLDPTRPDDTLPPEPFAEALLAELRGHGLVARTMVQSFDWRTLRHLQRLDPGLRRMFLTMDLPQSSNVRDARWTDGHRLEDHGGSVPRLVRAAASDTPGVLWGVIHRLLTPAQVKEAQALGLAVVPWTVNDPARMAELIGWGVDGLITDYPDRLRAVMAAHGLPLPPGVT